LVKGTSRRVIVVDSPDADLFEQAIFIVRSDIPCERGVTARMLVDEARRVARSCAQPGRKSGRRGLPGAPLLWALLGAAATGLIWLATALL